MGIWGLDPPPPSGYPLPGGSPIPLQALGAVAGTPPAVPSPFPDGISSLCIGSGGPCVPLPPPLRLPAPPVPSSRCPGRAGGSWQPQERGQSRDRVFLAQGSRHPGSSGESRKFSSFPSFLSAFWCFSQCLFLSPALWSQVPCVSWSSLVRRTPGNRGCLGMGYGNPLGCGP